jgi:hypothetical protein
VLCDPVPSTSTPASSAPVIVAETGRASTPSSGLQMSADPVPSTSTPASSAPVIVAETDNASPVLPGLSLCMSCECDPCSTSESVLSPSDQVPSTSPAVSSKIICKPNTSFSELMPTPKIVKRNVKAPRKSLNYRANCVRKELFTNSCNSKNKDTGSNKNMEPAEMLESEKSSSVGRKRSSQGIASSTFKGEFEKVELVKKAKLGKRIQQPGKKSVADRSTEANKNETVKAVKPKLKCRLDKGRKPSQFPRAQKKALGEQCSVCRILENSKEDITFAQDWVQCNMCMGWCHEVCGEVGGIFDDDYYTCAQCV